MLATPKNIPSSPGVYFFLDKKKQPLYIGKASNIKNRLGSYFHSSKDLRIQQMLDEATSVTWRVLGSEIAFGGFYAIWVYAPRAKPEGALPGPG